jgi:hypothetical protein
LARTAKPVSNLRFRRSVFESHPKVQLEDVLESRRRQKKTGRVYARLGGHNALRMI